MTRKSERELERAVEDLAERVESGDLDVDLTEAQAAAVREYDLRCDSLDDLDAEHEAALLEVASR